MEFITIFSELTVSLRPPSLNFIVKRTGSSEAKVTAANLMVDVSSVSTGAMLATSRTAGLIASGVTEIANFSEFSCIPVSLSVCVGGGGGGGA